MRSENGKLRQRKDLKGTGEGRWRGGEQSKAENNEEEN